MTSLQHLSREFERLSEELAIAYGETEGVTERARRVHRTFVMLCEEMHYRICSGALPGVEAWSPSDELCLSDELLPKVEPPLRWMGLSSARHAEVSWFLGRIREFMESLKVFIFSCDKTMRSSLGLISQASLSLKDLHEAMDELYRSKVFQPENL